jgi:uncharacterized membrane protein
MAIDTVMTIIHTLVGALWVGSVAFVAGVVLPAATDGSLDAAPLETIADRLVYLSRGASVVMLLTGGYLTVPGYTIASLTGTARGHLVLGMLALWFVFTALVEIGRGRLVDGLREKRVRAPASAATGVFRAAAVVGTLLLVDAGLLSSGIVLY